MDLIGTGMSHITPHISEINDSIRADCEENAPLWFPLVSSCALPHQVGSLLLCFKLGVSVFSIPITMSVLCYLNWLTEKLSVVIFISTKALISLQTKHSGVFFFLQNFAFQI